MSKRKEPELNEWNNLREKWTGRGPDPRIQLAVFSVRSYDKLYDPTDPFAEATVDSWEKEFKTIAAATKAYQKRIERPQTKQCDIMMHMKYGGYFQYFDEPFRPTFFQTYVYLVRWREDGAFLESYHINESKFGERNTNQATDELERRNNPGLLSYWQNKKDE